MTNHLSQVAQDLAWFKQCCSNITLVTKLKKISHFIIDVDGTLTDASMAVSEEKEEFRIFSIQDGYIVSFCHEAGLQLYLMSGKSHRSTFIRAQKLGIPDENVIVGTCKDKRERINAIREANGLDIDNIAMIGDDWLDANTKISGTVGMYIAPVNTVFYLHQCADLIIPRSGGDSAFRLFMDLILFIHGKHFAQNILQTLII